MKRALNRIDRLPLRQRVVLVIALGALLQVLGGWVTDRGGRIGWFGYAPVTGAVVGPGTMSHGVADLVYVGLIVVWAAVALWLLRSGNRESIG
jgi:cytochrome bd-type quinol oxidase subunit 1